LLKPLARQARARTRKDRPYRKTPRSRRVTRNPGWDGMVVRLAVTAWPEIVFAWKMMRTRSCKLVRKATMCFEINRCSDDFPIPKADMKLVPSRIVSGRPPGRIGSMTTTTCGINRMREFERVRGGDFGVGQGATPEATMCPEINRCESLPSRPQGRANAT
jgi:hypothetical protein